MKKVIFTVIGIFTTIFLFVNYYNDSSEFGVSEINFMGRLDKLEQYFQDTELTKIQTIKLNCGKAVYYMDCRKGKPMCQWEFLLVISDQNDEICAVIGTCYPNMMGGRTTVISRFVAKYWRLICNGEPEFLLFAVRNAPYGAPPLQVARYSKNKLHGEWTRIPAVSENMVLITQKGEKLLIELKKKKPMPLKRRSSYIPLAVL